MGEAAAPVCQQRDAGSESMRYRQFALQSGYHRSFADAASLVAAYSQNVSELDLAMALHFAPQLRRVGCVCRIGAVRE